ncbi:hypothetical protein KF728_21780 [Candidatus Obscuribacterales bacterium]|nr:hypothetical protein [Candidatus Obscuribacterales bacterium]
MTGVNMRISTLAGAFATVLLAALPAAAQAADGASAADPISSSVLWAAGIAGFLAFMLGSFPPNDEYAGSKFDLGGAFIWGVAAAAFVGGMFLFGSTGVLVPAAYGMGLGVVLAGFRFLTTRPPRVPKNYAVKNGVTRFDGDSTRAKYKAAEKAYNNASFNRNGYYATRGRDWRFNGASSELLLMLGESAKSPNPNTFAILVLLVRELPGESGEPAVVVVDSVEGLRQVKCEADGITVPGYDKKIPAGSITGTVGYAWR